MKLIKRSSLFKTYIAFNLILALLPVAIFAPLFFLSAHRQLKSEILTMRRFSLEQVMQNFDSRFKSFGSMALYASLDPDLTPYHLKSGDYGTITALRHLRLHSSPLNFEEIFLYIHRHDMFYGTAGSLNAKTFEQLYTLSGDWDWHDFYQLIDNPATYGASPPGCYLTEATVRDDAHVVIVYPWTNSSISYGTAIGLINVNFFDSLIRSISSDHEGETFVLDQAGKILFSQSQSIDQTDMDKAISAANTPGGKAVRINGQAWYTVLVSSELNGWQYLMMIPGSSITGILISETILLLYGLLLIVFCFAFLGIIIAQRYYLPIQKLSTILWGSGVPGRQAQHREMQQIQEHVSEIVHNNLSMSRELDENKEYVRQSLLYQIICGNADLDDASYRDRLDQLGIDLTGPCYSVVILRFISKLKAEERNRIIHVLQEAGYSIVEALYKEFFAILLNTKPDQTLIKDKIDEISTHLAALKFGKLTFGIGQSYADFTSLRQSFIEAIAAVECAADERMVFFSELTTDQPNAHDWLPSKAQIRLTEALRQGNQQAVQHEINELTVQLNALHAKTDQMHIHFVISSIIHQILRVINETDMTALHAEINQLIHYASIEDFISKLKHVCLELVTSISQTRMSRQNQMFSDVLQYIDSHFAEQDLSLTKIAEIFDMTSSTLSRLFSESTGMRFIDYLSSKRLQKAGELLIQTDLGIKEIVARIGYIDVSSFTRKFTSEFGQSPGRYRKEHKQA